MSRIGRLLVVLWVLALASSVLAQDRFSEARQCRLVSCNSSGVCDPSEWAPCPRFVESLTRPIFYDPPLSYQEPTTPVQGSGLPEDDPGTLFDWLKTHTSVVSGVALANGARSEFVSVSLDTDFELSPKIRGFGNLTLFSRSRVTDEGSVPQIGIPLSIDALAMYSSGQATGGAYRQVTPTFAVECRAGIVFAMIALTAHDVGEPVDGSKYIFGCGPRLTGGPGRLSIIFGHAGPVTEGKPLMGFIPSLIVSGEFRMPKSAALLLDIEAGRDRTTQQQVTSLRASVRKGF